MDTCPLNYIKDKSPSLGCAHNEGPLSRGLSLSSGVGCGQGRAPCGVSHGLRDAEEVPGPHVSPGPPWRLQGVTLALRCGPGAMA